MAYLGHAALQKAVFLRLSGDATLLALVAGIYDLPPETAVLPYLLVGDIEMKDWSTKTSDGAQCDVTLHAFSREGGRKQAAYIVERVYALLHNDNFSIDNHTLVSCAYGGSMIELGNDGWTYHARIVFRVLMQSN